MPAAREKEIFESRSVSRAVWELALPTMIGQIILVIYNMADTFFIGMTGSDAMLTAVTVCMPGFLFLSAIANLFGVGGGSAIARALGSGERERVGRAASFSLWGCVAAAAVYAGGVFVFREEFVDLLGGGDPAVHPLAAEYLLWTVAAGGIASAAGMLLSHLIRAEGRALHASVGIALGGVLNIALDPLFMFVLLPPGRETLGAALATALSNGVSLLYFTGVLLAIRQKSQLSFRFSACILKEGIPREIFAAGLPACVMTLLENVSYAVLDRQMACAGIQLQAGIGVAKKVNMLAHCMVRGVAQGSLPLIAYNYAAGSLSRMEEAGRAARRVAVGVAAVCTAAGLLLSRELVGIFIRRESDSLLYGAAFLRILCLGAPLSASAYIGISFFQAVGEGRRSFLLAVLRKGVIDIPLMFLLSAFFPVFGLVAATPAADGICCVAAAVLQQRYIKKLSFSHRPMGRRGVRTTAA